MTNKSLRKEIAIPQAILSYPYLFAKSPSQLEGTTVKEGKYKADILLLKDNPKHVLVRNQMLEAEKEILKSIGLRKAAHPVMKDNDLVLSEIDVSDEDGKKYYEKMSYLKNTWSFNTTNNNQPILQYEKGVSLNTSTDKNPFYPGCFVNVVIVMTGYINPNTKAWAGVGRSLQYVLFAKDGKPLASGASAVDGAKYFTDDDCEKDDFGTFKQNSDIPEKDIF